jgi:hypothetical protein
VASDETLIYRTEVLAILGAMADLVVEVKKIRGYLEDGSDEESEDLDD